MVWSRLDHPNIVPLVGFYLDLQSDVMWLISNWESLGNIVDYLAANEVDDARRLDLVRLLAAKSALYLSFCFRRSTRRKDLTIFILGSPQSAMEI